MCKDKDGKGESAEEKGEARRAGLWVREAKGRNPLLGTKQMFPSFREMESCFRSDGGGSQTEVGQRKRWEVQKSRELVEPTLSRNRACRRERERWGGRMWGGLEEGFCFFCF